jgi:hypothetical protein
MAPSPRFGGTPRRSSWHPPSWPLQEATVVKHISNIMMKLDLPPSTDQHRRVLAVLIMLGLTI